MSRHAPDDSTHLMDARHHLANAKRALRDVQATTDDRHLIKVAGRGERLVDQALRQALEAKRHTERRPA